ncbi:hypothetical protein [Clostridium felsineum]|uniref:Uncharacterized protein n=1 Tax=Clostridium felsineum TaxID=36839 RepID=A0A1S8MEW6_9CLOT|nr:hypothetical protein [Clostridium felsineum]URZ09259.1 hypothetical protein CLROS_046750 [Clostridium felsineum]URZ13945.1 hypothetical protein CROST_047230 [Clostridium felsineum]
MFLTPFNLRNEFRNLQHDFGEDILYIKINDSIKCSCFNEFYKVGDPDCLKCLGTGFNITIEKTKVINYNSMKNTVQHSKVGEIYSPIYTLYFDHTKNPEIKDRICLSEFSENQINIKAVCEITGTNAEKGSLGRNEFYTVQAKTRPELLTQTQNFFNNLSSDNKELIIKGNEVSC